MDKIIDLAPYLNKTGEETFKVTIGRSTYEVTTHFNPAGKQSVLEQFKELLIQKELTPHI